jgi:hypothetical protein
MRLTPELDSQWEKRELGNGQFYLYVPGTEDAASWPMREEIIDRILSDHDNANFNADWYEHAYQLTQSLERLLDAATSGVGLTAEILEARKALERYGCEPESE